MLRKRIQAFTLIEIMVVIAILGFMAAMVLPKMFRKPPSAEWKNILDDINNVVLFARQEAIANQKTFRVKFKMPREIVVEDEKDDIEKPGQMFYGQTTSFYFTTLITLSEFVTINGLYMGKQETMGDNKGEGYCYVISNGLVQDVIVHLMRDYEGVVSKMSLKMKPFVGQFEMLEGHVKVTG